MLKTSSPNDHRDTFRNTEKARYRVSFGLKKKVILSQMSTKRERDHGYVTLNARKSRLNVFPERSGKSDFGTRSTFLQRDILAKYGKIPSPASQSV